MSTRLSKVLGALAVLAALALFTAVQLAPNLHAPAYVSDKLVHAALYYGFALLLWRLLPSSDPLARASAVVALGFLIALLMEAGQARIPGRTRDDLDVVADLAGLLAASAALAWGAAYNQSGPLTKT